MNALISAVQLYSSDQPANKPPGVRCAQATVDYGQGVHSPERYRTV